MKRKIFSVLFALVLVLSLGLVTAVPAGASPGTLNVELPVNLTNTTDLDELSPSWSPDGSKIAYKLRDSGNYYVYVMDADGSNPTEVVDNGANNTGAPSWSPDGVWIAYCRDGAIYKSKSDGTGGETLIVDVTGYYTAGRAPSWSPDGNKLAYVVNREIDGICVYDISTTIETMIFEGAYGSTYSPAWSFDGTKIVFNSADVISAEGGCAIWVMDADGSNPTQITSTVDVSEFDPFWSPDGEKIVYVASTGGVYNLWIMDADGENQRQLTFTSVLKGMPSLCPDGNKIVYWSYGPKGDIYVINDFSHYTTIQAAIDAASPEDIIEVAAGEYVEDVTIDESVTLISDTGDYRTSEVTIEGQITVGAHDDITIQGFNFLVTPTLESPSEPYWGCGIRAHEVMGNNLNILSNSFTASPATSIDDPAISLRPGVTSWTGLLIDDNLFTGVRGMWVTSHMTPAASECTITNNVINGDPAAPAFAGIAVDTMMGVISDNKISYTWDAGINVGFDCSDLTISNNIITHAGCAKWGNAGAINVYSDCLDVEITGNTLADSYDGITVKNAIKDGEGVALSTTNPIRVTLNNIYGNSHYGIFNAASGTLNATNNWWGNASGPSGAGLGLGDAVNTIVTWKALNGLYDWLGELNGLLDDLRQLSKSGDAAALAAYWLAFDVDWLNLMTTDLAGVLVELGYPGTSGELDDLLETLVGNGNGEAGLLDDFHAAVDGLTSLAVLGLLVDNFSEDLGGFYGGLGAFSNTNVNYDPWLLEVVVKGETPTTYHKTLALKHGWTLVSTDKEVTTTSDWVGTKDLSPEKTVLAYGYALEAGVLAFGTVSATALEPVSALYVKTGGGGGVGINYSTEGAPTASEKQLLEGWNLISSASWDNAYVVLSPLHYVKIGEELGPGLATLESQEAYNQFTRGFRLVTLTEGEWAGLRGITLSPYDGYWVYMNAAKSFGVIPD